MPRHPLISPLHTAIVVLCLWIAPQRTPAQETDHSPSVSDPYEALYTVIMTRRSADGAIHGLDAETPLLWKNTRAVLKGEKFALIMAALSDFDALSQEKIDTYSAIKRALLQRHLWAAFDWSTTLQSSWDEKSHFDPEKQSQLQSGVAKLIPRLALTKAEIEALPDTIAATEVSGSFPDTFDPDDRLRPFFPKGLLDPNGPWVCISKSYHPITAPAHSEMRQSRSAFNVFIKLPKGRKATLDYVNALTAFEKLWVTEKPDDHHLTLPNGGINYVDIYINPETPQFPDGTQVALVEHALLIDRNGRLQSSPLAVGVQLRAYITTKTTTTSRAVAEFLLAPRRMMASEPDNGLRAVQKDERVFMAFGSSGDPFQVAPNPHRSPPKPTLQSCIVCHMGWGIHSVNSRAELFQLRHLLTPRLIPGDPQEIAAATIREKQKTYSWGLLEGLWRAD